MKEQQLWRLSFPIYPQNKHSVSCCRAKPRSLSRALVGTAASVKEELCPHASSALDLSNETQLRASRMCLLVGISSSLLCKPPSGGGKWYRAGASAKNAFIFAAPSLLSVKEQKCLSCSCNRVSPSSALKQLASRAMGLAGPAAPLPPSSSRRSSSPVSPGMFTGRAACVTGMAVTPSPSQPETRTSLRADAHQRGGEGVRKVVVEE